MDWRDDPIVAEAVATANLLDAMDLPEGTRLRGLKDGIEITEPGCEPYMLSRALSAPIEE